jgi:hypothetical protein
VVVSLTLGVVSAGADTPATVCLPAAPSKPVLSTNAKGACEPKYRVVQLPGSSELEALARILPHVRYVATGVAGKPTIQFSGVNVQVISGAGKTDAAVNGEGNLVIGYDDNSELGLQTGSHNLIIGDEQAFTSYAGLIAGQHNSVSAPYASVTGGRANAASGTGSSVSGGVLDSANGFMGRRRHRQHREWRVRVGRRRQLKCGKR